MSAGSRKSSKYKRSQKEEGVMQKWEYCDLDCGTGFATLPDGNKQLFEKVSSRNIVKALNQLGEEGWEAVGAFNPDTRWLLLKRPKV